MKHLPLVAPLALAFAVFGLATPALAGQPLQGLVIDGSTALPIPNATVRLVGRDLATTTDKYGRFQFPDVPAGTWTVEVSKPPFESTTDTVTVLADTPPEPLQLLLIGEVASVAVVEAAPKREKPPTPGGAEVAREEITHVPGARGDVLTAV